MRMVCGSDSCRPSKPPSMSLHFLTPSTSLSHVNLSCMGAVVSVAGSSIPSLLRIGAHYEVLASWEQR